MCGLFGYILKKPAGTRLAVLLAHYADQRGGQAWGYQHPTSGAVTKGLKRIMRHSKHLAQLSQVMAHTRLATQGANVVDNAHPFTFDAITLAHNGQIFNGSPKYTVDSMELADRVANGMALDDLEGYGVITWTNKAERGKIYLCKMTESGSIAVAKTVRGTVYASEKSAVASACEAAELKIKHFYQIDVGTVYFLDGSGVYTTALPKLTLSARSSRFSGTEWLDGQKWTRGEDGVYRMGGKSAAESIVDIGGRPDEWFSEGVTKTDNEWLQEPSEMTREMLETDLLTVGYTKEALEAQSFSDLCEAWEFEYCGATIGVGAGEAS